MKEYLTKKADGKYELAYQKWRDDDIEVPEGAELYVYWPDNKTYNFQSGKSFFESSTWNTCAWTVDEIKSNEAGAEVLWQRHTKPEELPSIDDFYVDTTTGESLNTIAKFADSTLVEGGTRDDNVNHPSHYTNGKIECIDALDSATVGKTGIEAVCVANTIKYLWRYEDKNGIEDVKKAKWYLDKLLTILENDSKQ